MRNHKLEKLQNENEQLRNALKYLKGYAEETFSYWDADKDMKVGKRLTAMAGRLPGYDPRLTQIHAITKKSEE